MGIDLSPTKGCWITSCVHEHVSVKKMLKVLAGEAIHDVLWGVVQGVPMLLRREKAEVPLLGGKALVAVIRVERVGIVR